MKILTKEEFVEATKYAIEKKKEDDRRSRAQIRARKIFRPITDKVFDDCWYLYLEVLDSSVRENAVAHLVGSGQMPNNIDYFMESFNSERPRCPECDAGLRIGYLNTDPSNRVGGNYKTYWYCERNDTRMCDENEPVDCDYVGEWSELMPYELAAESMDKIVEKVKNKCKGCK